MRLGGRCEDRNKHLTHNALISAVVLALVAQVSATPAVAANIIAMSPGAAWPLTDGGIGDVAPFSLETRGAGGDYARAYFANASGRRSGTAQPRTAAHSPLRP